MEFVCEVIHDATQTLSDHHPLLIRIALQPLMRIGMRKSSYHKLDVLELSIESTCAALQSIWGEHIIEGRDRRINWKLG